MTAAGRLSRLGHPKFLRKGVSRVTRIPLSPGDEVDAVVTTVTPFGVFVRTEAGVSGLVRAARDEVGTRLHLRVVEFDPDEQRFSAAVV